MSCSFKEFPGVIVFFVISFGLQTASVTLYDPRQKGTANFVEDEETTFVCTVECRPSTCKSIRVRWLLLDPKTNDELFFKPNQFEMFFTYTDDKGEASFTVVMRRDFSLKNVKCLRDGFASDTFTIPEIKKTINVEEVVLKSSDILLNQRAKLYCDVKAPSGIVRDVMFRNNNGRLRATEDRSMKNGWKRFKYVSNHKVGMQQNGSALQCMAITKSRMSVKGNVVSEMKLVIIHYFNFLSGKGPSMPKNYIARFSFTAEANPFPKANSFINHCKHPNGTIWRPSAKPMTIQKTGKDIFNITVNLYLRDACNYTLQFNSPMLSAESQSFFIDTIKVTYKSKVERRGPIIRKGGIWDLSFLLSSNVPLGIEDVQVLYKSKTGAQLVCPFEKSQSEMSLLPYRSRSRPIHHYFVRLTILPPISTTYHILINASGLPFKGPTLHVRFEESSHTTEWWCIVLMLVILFLLLSWLVLQWITEQWNLRKPADFIFIVLPNGQKCHHQLLPEVTVWNVIAFAQEKDPNLRISDLQYRGEYMTHCNNWRTKRLLKDWKMRRKEEIKIISRSLYLRLLIRNPFGDDKPCMLELYDEEIWKDVKERFAREHKQTIGDGGIAFSEAGFYSKEGKRQSATKCYVTTSATFFEYFDTETGDRIDETKIVQKIARFPQNESLLPHSAKKTPNISIRKSLKLFEVNQCWRLQPLEGTQGLWDSSFVLFFEGFRFGRGSNEKFYWRLENGEFFDEESGEIFEGPKSLPNYVENAEETYMYVYVLVRAGQLPPLLRIPAEKHLALYKRIEFHLDVKDGKVLAEPMTRTRPPNVEVWESVTDEYVDKLSDFLAPDYPSVMFTKLPNGIILEKTLQESLTVGDVMKSAQEEDKTLTVGNMKWNGNFLTRCADWREKRLIQDWGMKRGDIIHISAGPKALLLVTEDPQGQVKTIPVPLKDREETWEDVVKMNLDLESSFVFSKEIVYEEDGERKVAVRCEADNGKYFDKEEGFEVTKKNRKIFNISHRFLHETSLLPDVALRTPILYVRTELQFFCVENRKLKPISRNELWNKDYKMLLEGIGCVDDNCTFWRLHDGTFSDGTVSNKTFPLKEIPIVGKRRYVFVLLKEGDILPQLRVPDNMYLAVEKRLEASKWMGSATGDNRVMQGLEDVQRWERAEKTGGTAKWITAQALSSEEKHCVYLHLPSGVHRHIFRHARKVKDVVRTARSYEPTLRISDILHNDMPMTLSENWDQQEVKLKTNDIFTLYPRSSKIRLFIHAACESVLRRKKFILLFEETIQQLFEGIRKRANELQIGNSPIALEEIALYGEASGLKRAVVIYDAWSDVTKYIDEETGEEVDGQLVVCDAYRMLREDSLLPTTPKPRIHLYTDMTFYEMNRRCPKISDKNIICRSEFIVSLVGIKIESKFYWRLHDWSLYDGETREIFKERRDIPQLEKACYVTVFLKANDQPPKICVPAGYWLHVRRRSGMELSIQDGRICIKGDSKVEDDRIWESDTVINEFQNDITEAARSCSY